MLAAALAVSAGPVLALADDTSGKEDGRVGEAPLLPAAPDTSQPGTREALQTAPTLSRAEQLDALFQTLKNAKSDVEATTAENSIAAIWMKSGSDTVDLMMGWTEDAIQEKDYSLALDYLDRILTLKPDYVEGWNTRATVEYLTDDYGSSIADIEKTLKLEPRHFGALVGLATILREIGQEKRALEVFRYVYGIDPHLPHVKQAIDELTAKGADGLDG